MGRPRTRPDTPAVERSREQALRYYYGKQPLEPLPKAPKLSQQQNLDYQRAYQSRWRLEVQEVLNNYKLTKQCADCDRVFDKPYHLDFDHLPGSDKKFNLSKIGGGRSWPSIMAEVDKCEVVCALCHRTRTHERGYSTRKKATDRHDQQPTLWGEGATDGRG